MWVCRLCRVLVVFLVVVGLFVLFIVGVFMVYDGELVFVVILVEYVNMFIGIGMGVVIVGEINNFFGVLVLFGMV